MPPHFLNDWLGRRIVVHLLGVVLIVDVVADTDKFAVIVAARKEDDSDA